MIRKIITEKIEKHRTALEKINDQRRWWLYASSLVFVSLIFLIFGWDWIEGLHQPKIWWVMASILIIISINWWYWTMRIVRKFTEQQRLSIDIISELITDIKEIKDTVKRLK